MTADAEGLEALLAPVAAGLGFELVRLVVMKVTGRALTLQILAERPDGTMTIDDCARLSRAMSAVLDERDPVHGAYNLEVSSPGIDRPLVRPRDFERFTGREARLELRTAVAGQKRFKGVLGGMGDGKVLLHVAAEDAPAGFDVAAPLAVALDDIVKAKLIVSDALLKADLTEAERAAEARDADDQDQAGPDSRKARPGSRPGQRQKRSG